jgi:hypothetical protein
MKKTILEDSSLVNAVKEINAGLVDADLGGYLVKKRVALSGRGKRAGVRTIIATSFKGKYFFIYGFEKNEKANVSYLELEALKRIAKDWLSKSEVELNIMVQKQSLLEVVING